MKGYIFNPDIEFTKKIIDGVYKRDGHCPCRTKYDDTTICPCDDFIERGNCVCKLYVKVEDK